jgi:exodeoxyribonuclease III
MRLATWNVNSLKARLERVLAWTERHQPDVLCLQETKLSDAQAPLMDFRALGYDLVHHGPGRWNGVAIASRIGLEDVVAGMPAKDGWTDDGGRFLAATCGPMRVASIYVPNGRVVDSEFYIEKLEWLARLSVWLDDNDPTTELAICGDYNVAPEDIDVWDALAAHGGTHVSPRERAAVARLREWGMVDVVRTFHPEPGFFSWWDYRAGHFHKNFGMRIDHLLPTESLSKRVVAVEIDREARKGKPIPSDHAPLVLDLDQPGKPFDPGWADAEARIAARGGIRPR